MISNLFDFEPTNDMTVFSSIPFIRYVYPIGFSGFFDKRLIKIKPIDKTIHYLIRVSETISCNVSGFDTLMLGVIRSADHPVKAGAAVPRVYDERFTAHIHAQRFKHVFTQRSQIPYVFFGGSIVDAVRIGGCRFAHFF